MVSRKAVIGAGIALAAFGGGVAVAGRGVEVEGGGSGKTASLSCPGGMSRLGHVFGPGGSVFEGDPLTEIEIVATIDADGYLVEKLTTGVHNGTHLDVPAHFIPDGRSIDELQAQEFVWPAYVIDVRQRMAATEDDSFQLTVDDIRAVERRQGRIPKGAMVIIQTGFDQFYGTEAYDAPAPGFSGDAVQWMVDQRRIGGVGSDTYGPDATSDVDFAATYTILANDRVAMPDIANVDSLNRNGDIIIASAVPLVDGSAFMVDPLACHARGR
ncbi:MAG: cyclase family protein [Acidimicrobiales bacterium]|nr:cyclase family protein [Acidimicrobiales bacterium]MCB9395729.1 cyclase family protein [Acidimicrobiaceae bacterium]